MPSASTMKYMTGLCSKTSLHCASLSRRNSVARCSALTRLSSAASICLRVFPTRRITIKAARKKATSSATAINWLATSGAGPSTSQMHAAASAASAMPPSSDCSGEGKDFSVWLRMTALAIRRAGLGRVSRRRPDDPSLNLGMILSTTWNVWINLSSMVWPISLTRLADWVGSNGAVCNCHRESPRETRRPPRCQGTRATNLGIDMSKPRLQLIHCSNGIRPRAKRRQNGRSFQPLVIDGGVKSALAEHSWETALALFNLGLHVCHGNYLAFLEASMIILNDLDGTDPERAGRSV